MAYKSGWLWRYKCNIYIVYLLCLQNPIKPTTSSQSVQEARAGSESLMRWCSDDPTSHFVGNPSSRFQSRMMMSRDTGLPISIFGITRLDRGAGNNLLLTVCHLIYLRVMLACQHYLSIFDMFRDIAWFSLQVRRQSWKYSEHVRSYLWFFPANIETEKTTQV